MTVAVNWLMAAFILILTFMVMVGLYALMLLEQEDGE